MTRRWLSPILLAMVWAVFGSLSPFSANSAAAYVYDGTPQLSSRTDVPPLVPPLDEVAASRAVVVVAANSVAAAKTGFASEGAVAYLAVRRARLATTPTPKRARCLDPLRVAAARSTELGRQR